MKKSTMLAVFALALAMAWAMAMPSMAFAAQKATLAKGAATEISLYVDSATQNTAVLKVKGYKAAKGKWSTSKKKVATVKKGKVTAKKTGKAKIVAKYGKKTFTAKVTVKRVSISQTSAMLGVGDSLALTLDGDAVKAVSSSNPSVASVTPEGVVSAKRVGSAAVMLTSKKGNDYACEIVVIPVSSAVPTTPTAPTTPSIPIIPTIPTIPDVVAVTGVSFAKSELAMQVGDELVSNPATVTPSNATVKTVVYSSVNPKVATVDDKGTVTAVAEGETTIIAAAAGGIAMCKVEVSRGSVTVGSLDDLKQLLQDGVDGVKGRDVIFETEDGTKVNLNELGAELEKLSDKVSPEDLKKLVEGVSTEDLEKLTDQIPLDDLKKLADEIPFDDLEGIIEQLPAESRIPNVSAEELEKIKDSILERISQYANGQTGESSYDFDGIRDSILERISQYANSQADEPADSQGA